MQVPFSSSTSVYTHPCMRTGTTSRGFVPVVNRCCLFTNKDGSDRHKLLRPFVIYVTLPITLTHNMDYNQSHPLVSPPFLHH